MPELPSQTSPTAPPLVPDDDLSSPPTTADQTLQNNESNTVPTSLISPTITPPSTPGTGTPAPERNARSVQLDVNAPLPAPALLETLPEVNCVVRARIPTTTGTEMFLHLYQNNIDAKEHLAIVFGSNIRSSSLDQPRPGETEMDRMIRGAYTGRLYPGRESSSVDKTTSEVSTSQKSFHKVPSSVASSSSSPSSRTPQAHKDTANVAPASPLVRIHSECYTGETVWSARCDCGEQLDEAARLMSLPSASSGGVIVYLRQEGRGIGLGEKLKAYNLQDLGSDTVEANLLLRHPADKRSYGLATAILLDLGLGGAKGIRLLTNNPDKVRAVEGPQREVIVKERVAMIPISWSTGGAKGFNSAEVGAYLRTKIEKMGHMMQM